MLIIIACGLRWWWVGEVRHTNHWHCIEVTFRLEGAASAEIIDPHKIHLKSSEIFNDIPWLQTVGIFAKLIPGAVFLTWALPSPSHSRSLCARERQPRNREQISRAPITTLFASTLLSILDCSPRGSGNSHGISARFFRRFPTASARLGEVLAPRAYSSSSEPRQDSRLVIANC